MDKEITIDGVNVKECEFLRNCIIPDNYDCKIDNNLCCDVGNCYYKQLKRLEQENAEFKAELQKFQDMAAKGLEEFKDVGGCWGCGLQLQLNQDIKDIKQLKAELDTYKKIWNDKEVHIALTDVRTGERKLWYENCLKYKSCLQEIKAIAENAYCLTNYTNKDMANFAKQILDLITKAEEE